MALLESNFENRLSFVEESTKMELHRELNYRRPNHLAPFFLSVGMYEQNFGRVHFHFYAPTDFSQ